MKCASICHSFRDFFRFLFFAPCSCSCSFPLCGSRCRQRSLIARRRSLSLGCLPQVGSCGGIRLCSFLAGRLYLPPFYLCLLSGISCREFRPLRPNGIWTFFAEKIPHLLHISKNLCTFALAKVSSFHLVSHVSTNLGRLYRSSLPDVKQ